MRLILFFAAVGLSQASLAQRPSAVWSIPPEALAAADAGDFERSKVILLSEARRCDEDRSTNCIVIWQALQKLAEVLEDKALENLARANNNSSVSLFEQAISVAINAQGPAYVAAHRAAQALEEKALFSEAQVWRERQVAAASTNFGKRDALQQLIQNLNEQGKFAETRKPTEALIEIIKSTNIGGSATLVYLRSSVALMKAAVGELPAARNDIRAAGSAARLAIANSPPETAGTSHVRFRDTFLIAIKINWGLYRATRVE